MPAHSIRRFFAWSLPLLVLALAGPAQSDARSITIAELLAGSAVPNSIKLKDLTADWRRLSISGEAVLGMGAIQSLMQGVGSMFGGGSGFSDALYTKGDTVKIGDQEYLIGYRLPPQGIDFGALIAMAGAGNGPAGGPPQLSKRAPITPETDLTLSLINLRSIASITDIRPYDMSEAMKPAPPGLLEGIFNGAQQKAVTGPKPEAKSSTAAAVLNMKQLATAVMLYEQDYDETFPPLRDAASFKKAVMPYVKNDSVFKSPGTDQPFQPNPRLSGRKLASVVRPEGLVMLYSAVPEPDGSRVVARADGTVRNVTAAEWQKLSPAQGLPGP